MKWLLIVITLSGRSVVTEGFDTQKDCLDAAKREKLETVMAAVPGDAGLVAYCVQGYLPH